MPAGMADEKFSREHPEDRSRPRPLRDPLGLTALERPLAGRGRPTPRNREGLQRSQDSERAKQGDPTVALVRSRKRRGLLADFDILRCNSLPPAVAHYPDISPNVFAAAVLALVCALLRVTAGDDCGVP
jgi:hypothetical protein